MKVQGKLNYQQQVKKKEISRSVKKLTNQGNLQNFDGKIDIGLDMGIEGCVQNGVVSRKKGGLGYLQPSSIFRSFDNETNYSQKYSNKLLKAGNNFNSYKSTDGHKGNFNIDIGSSVV